MSSWLALPWTGETLWDVPPAERLPDVGERVEVRWAMSSTTPMLTYDAERDCDDRFYVLVTGFAPEYEIHGYILGANARRPEWRHRYPERVVYRVPAAALMPLERR